MRTARMGTLLLAALVMSACSADPEPVHQQTPSTETVIEEFDGTLAPSAAVLPLVPESATSLRVTDFGQLRLTLGFAGLDSTSPAGERAAFSRAVASSGALSAGMLDPVDDRLRADFDFGAADVAWQAEYDDPAGGGWVLAFTDDVAMGSVQRAVQAGVGPLRGAVVDPDRRLVTSDAVPDPAASWGADPEIVALAGDTGNATVIARGCLPFDQVFGAGMEDDLAEAPADALEELEPLDGYAVVLGSAVATVRLGEDRADIFDRLTIAGVMPRLRPEFGTAFARGVADPGTGRLGFQLTRPAVAAELTLEGHLPFAVCAG